MADDKGEEAAKTFVRIFKLASVGTAAAGGATAGLGFGGPPGAVAGAVAGVATGMVVGLFRLIFD
uniref:Uncharacterized protein n=1 Tax=Meloidogyne incognita TaxID=6306 RepID=A0A914L2I5_MELIC